jgi:hypothetical protein
MEKKGKKKSKSGNKNKGNNDQTKLMKKVKKSPYFEHVPEFNVSPPAHNRKSDAR